MPDQAHHFEPHGSREICRHCGLIMHRGNEVTPCPGPRLLGGRFQLGQSAAEAVAEYQSEAIDA